MKTTWHNEKLAPLVRGREKTALNGLEHDTDNLNWGVQGSDLFIAKKIIDAFEHSWGKAKCTPHA